MTAASRPAAPNLPLLFDENLAPSLAQRLTDLYTGSTHVRDVGLAMADDEGIWLHARTGGYIIVTKDDETAALLVIARP
jgi:predicted nuclease of predicted toxin-antitoxin system